MDDIERAKKDWKAMRLKNQAVGEYIDFNNFLNFWKRKEQEKRELIDQNLQIEIYYNRCSEIVEELTEMSKDINRRLTAFRDLNND